MEVKEFLQKLVNRENLSAEEAEAMMDAKMKNLYTPAQVAALLVALKMKGESIEEISSFAKVMRKNAVRINPKVKMLVDTCGTGGDFFSTFNISTASAFVVAGAGISVAKHGNKSISSKCGSADVIEAFGGKMLLPLQVERCIEEIGIGFMFAPFFHPAMKNVAPIRKELGIRTVFNILGPLTNPANANVQLIGVYDPLLTEIIAQTLNLLGTEHALVVHSEGMDEIGLGKTKISELKNGKIENYILDASEFGFVKNEIPRVNSDLESAEIIKNVLNGKKSGARDVVLLNSAAAIYVGGKAKNINEGIEIAKHSIDSGNAAEKLNQFILFTKSFL